MKAHEGIAGNELADQHETEAASSCLEIAYAQIPTSYIKKIYMSTDSGSVAARIS